MPDQWWLQTQAGTWHQFGCPYLRGAIVRQDVLVGSLTDLPRSWYGGGHSWAYETKTRICEWCRNHASQP